MASSQHESEGLWAEQMTELLGGAKEDPFGINGAVSGFSEIDEEGVSYRQLCIRLPRDAGKGEARLVLSAIGSVLREVMPEHVRYDVAADASGIMHVVLEWLSEDPHEESGVKAFARAVTILLEQEHETEIHVGIGISCRSLMYLPFSRAYAMQHITHFNVSRSIQNVLTYVSINYSDPELTVGKIARDNYLSYPYLCTQFKKETGITLNRYIQRFRMRTAAALLTLPNRSILDISRAVGCPDIKYFSRQFKATYELTPHQYREVQRASRVSLTEI